MAATGKLRDVVDHFEMLSDERTAYLNKVSGELYLLTEEELFTAEEDEDGGKAALHAVIQVPVECIPCRSRLLMRELRTAERRASCVRRLKQLAEANVRFRWARRSLTVSAMDLG